MKHDLKIWPQYFCRVEDGSKTFEVRTNDRGFQPGDEVTLKEWSPTVTTRTIGDNDWTPMSGETYTEIQEPVGYTGNSLSFRIGYVLPIDSERVVFSLLPMESP